MLDSLVTAVRKIGLGRLRFVVLPGLWPLSLLVGTAWRWPDGVRGQFALLVAFLAPPLWLVPDRGDLHRPDPPVWPRLESV